MYFGIRPWEIELVTPLELEKYLDKLDDLGRMAKEARASGK